MPGSLHVYVNEKVKSSFHGKKWKINRVYGVTTQKKCRN